jgi:hypothetical protein
MINFLIDGVPYRLSRSMALAVRRNAPESIARVASGQLFRKRDDLDRVVKWQDSRRAKSYDCPRPHRYVSQPDSRPQQGQCQRRRENASVRRSRNAPVKNAEGPGGDLLAFRRDGAAKGLVEGCRREARRCWAGGSILAESSRWVDCLELGEIELADRLQHGGQRAVLQVDRRRLQPGGILRRRFCQFGDSVMPTPGPSTMIGRAVRANDWRSSRACGGGGVPAVRRRSSVSRRSIYVAWFHSEA